MGFESCSICARETPFWFTGVVRVRVCFRVASQRESRGSWVSFLESKVAGSKGFFVRVNDRDESGLAFWSYKVSVAVCRGGHRWRWGFVIWQRS